MRRSVFLFLMFSQLIAACVSEELAAPVLHQICLMQDELNCINKTFAGESPSVILLADHLHPTFVVDLGSTNDPAMSGPFAAWFNQGSAQVDLGQVTLASHPWRGSQALEATVPAGLSVGLQDATIQTPSGLQAFLPSAFLILDPLSVDASIPDAQVPMGSSFRLNIHLTNQAQSEIQQVAISLAQSGQGSCDLPASISTFNLAGNSDQTISFDLPVVGLGEMSLFVSVSGMANGIVPVGTSAPIQMRLAVLSDVSLGVTARVTPATNIHVGTQLSFRVTVANSGQTSALSVRLLAPLMNDESMIQFENPPAAKDIPAASEITLVWKALIVKAGTLTLTARAAAIEAVSGRLLEATAQSPISVDIQP